jgi:hypothetical protein
MKRKDVVMSKMDIEISRTMTINAGNFNAFKPTVSIVLHEIDVKNLKHIYERMSDIVDSLLAKEIIKLHDEMSTLQKIGVDKYCSELKNQESSINESIENSERN